MEANEPRGLWHGQGVELLGLAGIVDDAAFLAVMAGGDPSDPERLLGLAFTEKSVRGFDVTASSPKSVSVLWAVGDDHVRAEVLAAHDAAVAALAGWIEAHAHTRYRVNGEVVVVDAEGIVAAGFRQHTSRALDPQLHTHLVVANRVKSPNGRWLALDARTLKRDQRTLSALFHAAERAELTRRLGVEWGPVVNGTALHDRWAAQLRDLDVDPNLLVGSVIGRTLATDAIDRLDQRGLVDDALEVLTEAQSSWRPAEIVRELAAILPTTLAATADEVVGLVDSLGFGCAAHEGIELGPPPVRGVVCRESDGRPITESVLDRAITQWWILEEEAFVLDWAARGVDPHQTLSNRATLDRCREVASVAQREAAAAIAGTARVVLVVGPAGTGKTTAMRPAVEQLQADGRVVFGVAPSAIAAGVLSAETGVVADTIDKLLTEHHSGRPQPRFDLPVGSTVIVDEAGMLGTAKLANLIRLAEDRVWRVALVGDPLQFSSVGRGGMFGMLVDTHGGIELDHVHRFTNDWERTTSLQLRSGDPADYLELADGIRLHVGDVIATRRNDRGIETNRNEMVRNRNTFTLTALHPDGGVAAVGETGFVILPAGYVAEHVELAYAVTSMGAQGRTVDHAITVLDGVTDVRNIYVPMTRGRDSNHAYITIDGEDTATDVFARYITNDWIDLPAHQRAHELWAPTGQEPDWPTRVITHEDDFGIDL